MGGVDVVLSVQWLQSLGTLDFNFQKLFMKFSWQGEEFPRIKWIALSKYPLEIWGDKEL